MLKFLVIFFIFSPTWASKLIKTGKVLEFLSAHPERSQMNSVQETRNREKCQQMFSTNPDFSNWQGAIEEEKKAKRALLLAEELAQEAQSEYLIAKKIRKMHEKAFKTASPQTHDQAFDYFQTALTKEQSALEEKEMAKQMLKKNKKLLKHAKLILEITEEAFKKSIPRTFTQDFEDLALKQFQNVSLQSNE